MKFYPPADIDGSMLFRTGQVWIYADITCPTCGKEQPVAATRYVGGPCVRCGALTINPPEGEEYERGYPPEPAEPDAPGAMEER